MSRLLAAEPAEVLDCALRLDDAARRTWTAKRAAARAEDTSWHGPARHSFDARLAAVGADLTAVGTGQAEMAEVLQGYARLLQEAQATARRAQQLSAEAAAPMGGQPTKAQAEHRDALSSLATRLMQEAERQEQEAAQRAAARLQEVAARAPQARRLAATERFVDDVVDTLRDSGLGLVGTWVAAAGALPLVNGERRQREARRELAVTAQESVMVWRPFVDAYRSAVDGRWGQTVGGLAGVIAFRKGGRVRYVHQGRVKRGQDKHVKDVLRRIGEANATAARMTSARQRVDLLTHEAAGGHTLLEHVGRPSEYLAWRAHQTGSASTFPDEPFAARAIEEALLARRGQVDVWLAGSGSELILTSDLRRPVGSGHVRGNSKEVVTRVVLVVLRRNGSDSFRVHTAFPLVAR